MKLFGIVEKIDFMMLSFCWNKDVLNTHRTPNGKARWQPGTGRIHKGETNSLLKPTTASKKCGNSRLIWVIRKNFLCRKRGFGKNHQIFLSSNNEAGEGINQGRSQKENHAGKWREEFLILFDSYN